MRSQAQLEQYAGHRLVVDLASFKLKAWYSDIAHYYRPMEPQTHGYRGVLARLLLALSLATGSTSNVTVCLDGGLFPPKSREHSRRRSSGPDRDEIQEAKDAEGAQKDADKLQTRSSCTPHHHSSTRG